MGNEVYQAFLNKIGNDWIEPRNDISNQFMNNGEFDLCSDLHELGFMEKRKVYGSWQFRKLETPKQITIKEKKVKVKEYPTVERGISWIDLLGENQSAMPDKLRRERWEEWKKKAGKNIADYWVGSSQCNRCVHKDNDWCQSVQLPCAVNPVLTLKNNITGLACMGLGREEVSN